MTITIKKNINPESIILQHRIITQTISLISGREESLNTEKEMYLILSMLSQIVEEDLIKEINEDERGLADVVEQELEPFFFNLLKDENYRWMYNKMRDSLFEYFDKLYERQHSFMGVLESILTSIGSLSEEDTKEILEGVKQSAAKVYEHRTEIMEKQAEKVNNNLEQLVEQYKTKVEE